MIASAPAFAGEMRPPSPGRPASPAVRIVIHASPLFQGRVKLPAKVAPGCSAIVSPGCAALIACCRFAPAGTEIVDASAEEAHSRTPAHTRVTTKMFFITFGPGRPPTRAAPAAHLQDPAS